MDERSQNGRRGGHEESPEEHRATHFQNLLDEVLTLLFEDAQDEETADTVIDSVLLALVDAAGAQGFRLPRALMDALASWVGADDPRDYLRSVYANEQGQIAPDTPEQISRYLRSTDEEYWPDED